MLFGRDASLRLTTRWLSESAIASNSVCIDTMLNAIVGFEIEITRLVGKSKLSQNREVRDIRNAGETLKAQGDHVIGGAMLACDDAKHT